MSQPAVLEGKPWKQRGIELITVLAEEGVAFDAYTLTQRGLPNPPHHNQWGPLFRSARAKGLIEVADSHNSARPKHSGGLCRVWRKAQP